MPAKKTSRRARLIVIVVVLLLVAGIGGGTYWGVSTVRDSFPQTAGTLKLKALEAPVSVKRDGSGIPQLYADNSEDLFLAQGYVQAQDRFWEMDVRRHMTSGRLSEMFGAGQVETDAFLRTLGWRRVAEKEYKQLPERTKEFLKSYSEGVNAYLEDHEGSALSVEYAALDLDGKDYKPAPWDPVDSVAWLKAMAWDLRGNMSDEVDRALMTSRLDKDEIEQLYPEYPYDRNKPIVDHGAVDPASKEFDPKADADAEADETGGPDTANGSGTGTDAGQPGSGGARSPSDGTGGGGVASGGSGTQSGAQSAGEATQGASTQLGTVAKKLDKIPGLLGPNGSGIGSNSWVVSGKYTTTGKPLLANDPHLAPQLPSVWYQMGLHCRSVDKSCPFDVSGFTFSGMPGVVIGHNQDISWGLTNLGADVTDLYLEKVSDGHYLYDGKEVPYRTREETIKVAGGKDRTITVRETNNGPVVSDRDKELRKVGDKSPVGNAAPDRGDGYAVSLRWTALEPSKTMDAVFQLNRASDFSEFRKAARDFAVPSQNLIYADTKGNIGYQAPGRIPVREKGDGRYPAPGWDSRYRWKGYIPQRALPWEYNPDRGYVVTANQAVVDREKYPYLLTDDWGYGARSQRINDLIQSKIKDGGKISIKDMESMQMDNSSEIAKLLVPYLLKIDVKDPYVREAQKLLEGWDYTQDSDSAPAAYFNAVWRNLLKLAFGDKLPKELRVEGDCLYVAPSDDSGPVDDLSGEERLVRECGRRSADTAQPDGGDRWFEVVRKLLKKPDSDWWKTRGTVRRDGDKNRDDLLGHAMKDARWELTSKLGKDIDTWSWGRLHRLMLKNQTLGTEGPGVVQWLLNRGPWDLSGGEAAVNATGWNAAGGYDVTWVPSMRMVVNLSDLDNSRWINLTGASGHTYNAHYTDQTDKWARGEFLKWPYSEKAVAKATEDQMALTP
ncbi:penicillin acylase family protein [Streptomyces reniochalinae]|uniref:Penicillin acylase family protein n=1 Tax=Streptomyces reniochalinae TaxID=2250578 RepID=A0A367EYV6_9ACTN|nr:penicillin acylase family protein [Streptomyces reniochalinae]RCG23328.1 penicillin acylase family protein [Streptomyces reniochalinae]